MESELILHEGGCHCGKIKWRVKASTSVAAWNCNCSDCSMRGNVHFIVPSSNFELLDDSKDFITTYTFGTHTAKHTSSARSVGSHRFISRGLTLMDSLLRLSVSSRGHWITSRSKAMMGRSGRCRTKRPVLPRFPKSDMIRLTQDCNWPRRKESKAPIKISPLESQGETTWKIKALPPKPF